MTETRPTGPARERPERPAAAALLNASALGAGYVYLRRWGDACIYWAGLVAWLLLASSTGLWLVAIVAWVGAAVVRGFLLGRPPAAHLAPAGAWGPTSSWTPPSHQAGPGPIPSPVDASPAPSLVQDPTPAPPQTATGAIPLRAAPPAGGETAAPSDAPDPADAGAVVGTAGVATAPSPMIFVRPFSGTWPLSGGTLYADCYYLQAASVPDPAVG